MGLQPRNDRLLGLEILVQCIYARSPSSIVLVKVLLFISRYKSKPSCQPVCCSSLPIFREGAGRLRHPWGLLLGIYRRTTSSQKWFESPLRIGGGLLISPVAKDSKPYFERCWRYRTLHSEKAGVRTIRPVCG
jgi:hypothetical protein